MRLRPYISTFSAFLRAWRQRTRLLVCEVEHAIVIKPWARVRPFNLVSGFKGATKGSEPKQLDLTGWRLAHAVMKADFIKPPPYPSDEAAAFALSVASTLDWRQAELRLYSGASRARTDFAGTTLAGRIGQGVALLVMDSMGYTYHSHYERNVAERGPDFIVESRTTRSFVEAKGAFVAPGQNPSIKAVLKDGLEQIGGCCAPGVTKSFVVATFLRETGDSHSEPSLVALVDPETVTTGSDDWPDWVVRQNYAAWLRAMGLHSAASDLRSRIRHVLSERIYMWSKKIEGAEYLFLPFDSMRLELVDATSWLPSDWLFPEDRIPVLGIERATFGHVLEALQDPSCILRGSKVDDAEQVPLSRLVESEEFYGSIMNDGSLFGAISAESLNTIDLKEIDL